MVAGLGRIRAYDLARREIVDGVRTGLQTCFVEKASLVKCSIPGCRVSTLEKLLGNSSGIDFRQLPGKQQGHDECPGCEHQRCERSPASPACLPRGAMVAMSVAPSPALLSKLGHCGQPKEPIPQL